MKDHNLIRQVEDYIASPLLKEDLLALDEKSRVSIAVKVWQEEKKTAPEQSGPDANLELAMDIQKRLEAAAPVSLPHTDRSIR